MAIPRILQAVTALLNLTLSDDHYNVREKALATYKEHPKAFNLTSPDHLILNKYSYSIHFLNIVFLYF